MKLRDSLLAAAFVAFAADAASASTVILDKEGTNLFGGVPAQTVTISNHSGSVLAGGFRLTDGTSSLIAWCLDTSHNLSLEGEYNTTNTPFEQTTGTLSFDRQSNIQKLFNTSYSQDLVADSVKSAAFQLVLWELIYEATTTAFNVESGDFFASAKEAVLDYANDILLYNLNYGQNINNFELTFYESTEGGQNLVSATPVPLPAAVLFLGSGLAGLAWAGRRKKDISAAA